MLDLKECCQPVTSKIFKVNGRYYVVEKEVNGCLGCCFINNQEPCLVYDTTSKLFAQIGKCATTKFIFKEIE